MVAKDVRHSLLCIGKVRHYLFHELVNALLQAGSLTVGELIERIAAGGVLAGPEGGRACGARHRVGTGDVGAPHLGRLVPHNLLRKFQRKQDKASRKAPLSRLVSLPMLRNKGCEKGAHIALGPHPPLAKSTPGAAHSPAQRGVSSPPRWRVHAGGFLGRKWRCWVQCCAIQNSPSSTQNSTLSSPACNGRRGRSRSWCRRWGTCCK